MDIDADNTISSKDYLPEELSRLGGDQLSKNEVQQLRTLIPYHRKAVFTRLAQESLPNRFNIDFPDDYRATLTSNLNQKADYWSGHFLRKWKKLSDNRSIKSGAGHLIMRYLKDSYNEIPGRILEENKAGLQGGYGGLGRLFRQAGKTAGVKEGDLKFLASSSRLFEKYNPKQLVFRAAPKRRAKTTSKKKSQTFAQKLSPQPKPQSSTPSSPIPSSPPEKSRRFGGRFGKIAGASLAAAGLAGSGYSIIAHRRSKKPIRFNVSGVIKPNGQAHVRNLRTQR